MAARDLAVADFIAKNFKGWTLNGTNTEFGICGEDDDDPCYLHLVKGSGAKVVPVMIREFEKSDKSTYWLVYEAHSVDIARAKIARGKEIAREEGSQDANSTESR